jgi:UDP-glucose 6-dehydrogenase
MRTLSTDIEELGTKLLEDDQLILKMLSSLQHNNMLSPKLTSKTDVSKGDRHSKNISLTTITPKKRKSNQEKRYMSNTTKTVRRFNTQPTIVFERCSFPKMMRKQSTARSQTSSKRQKKMMKAE